MMGIRQSTNQQTLLSSPRGSGISKHNNQGSTMYSEARRGTNMPPSLVAADEDDEAEVDDRRKA